MTQQSRDSTYNIADSTITIGLSNQSRPGLVNLYPCEDYKCRMERENSGELNDVSQAKGIECHQKLE
jgi:hypothetical protein